jgi:hypothetical protein
VIPRQRFIDAVLSCVGTPVVHFGRVPGHGLDCVGLIWAAGRMAGLEMPPTPSYGPLPNGEVMTAGLSLYADPCSPEDAHIFQVYAGKQPRHAVVPVAVDGDRVEVVHAWGKHATVKRVQLVDRIAACWRLRGIE